MVICCRARRAAALLAAWAVVAGLAGCSRERYFWQADQEVKSLIAEKSDDPRWAAPADFNVMMDPRSRFYDPCDPIRPPMPPDDPASHRYMHCVDGKRGWPRWHANGDRRELENPNWWERLREYAEVTPEGRLRLSLESALRIAYINSPSYQQQLETVYLSALDVSAERFRFDTQFFGGTATDWTHVGRLRAGGQRSTLSQETDFQLRRRFATAGELLVGFANSMVWQFAGPDTSSNLSLVNFSLVQPLLRGAGRDVVLEQLTIAERALLANLRALQRYRQGFFTLVAIGNLGVSGPQRRGGFFGGTGLTGFTGTGAGGLGGVGEAVAYGRGGFGGAAGGVGAGAAAGLVGGGAGQVGGFIGLLQQLQQIRNSEETLALQLRTLGLLEEQFKAGTIDRVQLYQFQQNIETVRATLLQARNSLEDAVDSYNTATLGLPPHVPVELDDSLIRQFQLIDPAISHLQDRISAFRTEFGQQPEEPELEALRQAIERLGGLSGEVASHVEPVGQDLAETEARSAARTAEMTPSEQKQFAEDLKRNREDYAELRARLRQLQPQIEQLGQQLAPAARQKTARRLIELLGEVATIADGLSLVQARARLERVTVEHETLDPETALQIARANRLDWMNNRAALVDTWRLIQFNADALQSGLSVTLSGDMSTVGDNPVKFRAPAGTLRAGLQLDAPFTRLLERNNFRQALITYEADRRQLIQFEDSVEQTLRGLLRQLEQLRMNLEIQRRATAIAIGRVDVTRLELTKPVPELGPTAAQNLLQAMNDMGSAQNNFMSAWLVYQATRMRLARELGIMELDERGMWIDRPLSEAARASAEEAPLPPAVPEVWLEQLDQLDQPATPDPETPEAPAKIEANGQSAEPAPGRKAPGAAWRWPQAALPGKQTQAKGGRAASARSTRRLAGAA